MRGKQSNCRETTRATALGPSLNFRWPTFSHSFSFLFSPQHAHHRRPPFPGSTMTSYGLVKRQRLSPCLVAQQTKGAQPLANDVLPAPSRDCDTVCFGTVRTLTPFLPAAHPSSFPSDHLDSQLRVLFPRSQGFAASSAGQVPRPSCPNMASP